MRRPRHQGLELWLTEYPQPRPPRETWEDDPIFNAMQGVPEHHVENPEFMGIHYMDATSPEECWRLLRQTGKSISYESLANVPRYSEWLAGQDWTAAYERHRANLQLIGSTTPTSAGCSRTRRHLVALDALMKVYPDALIVGTHRDPVTSIASACSLSADATAGTLDDVRRRHIGRTQLELLVAVLAAFTEAREKYDAAQFVDVDYRTSWPTPSAPSPVSTTPSTSPGRRSPGRGRGARRRVAHRTGPPRPSHRYDLAKTTVLDRRTRSRVNALRTDSTVAPLARRA